MCIYIYFLYLIFFFIFYFNGIQNISLRNISYNIFNVFKTKIDGISFLSLDKIIIKANTDNPDKNGSEKMILLLIEKIIV